MMIFVLLLINLGIIIPMSSNNLVFAYYYNETTGEYCNSSSGVKASNSLNYTSTIKEQLLKYNIDISDFTNCSFINSSYIASKLDYFVDINYCINIYISSQGLNNLNRTNKNILDININDTLNVFNENLYIDYDGNLYCLKYNDKIEEIELIYNHNNLQDTFTLSSDEFLEFLIKYFGISSKYDENSLHELQDQYLTRDSDSNNNNRFYLENIPFQYSFTTLKTKYNTISINDMGTSKSMRLNASSYETCLGLPYNLENDILEIHNLMALSNNDIDDIFANYNEEHITLKFKYTKGYVADLPKLLRILKYINNNYEYRIDMCQTDKTYDTHEYITVDKYKCKYSENYNANEQIDKTCQDVIIDYNKDVISKNFNPSHVNFQIVGDTPINNYLRRSLKKVKAFAINEIIPESVNMNDWYKPRFEQNKIMDKFELEGIIKSYNTHNIIVSPKYIEVNVKDITALLKPIYSFNDNYTFDETIKRSGTTSQSDYCYKEIGHTVSNSNKACINTHHYVDNIRYNTIINSGDKLIYSGTYYNIVNETKYCENNIECDVDKCAVCSKTNYCSKCIDSTNYKAINGTCVLQCDSLSCAECIDDKNTCKTCFTYYKPSDDNKKCIVDVCKAPGCQTCEEDNIYSCKVCKPNYDQIGDSCKIKCSVDNCDICNNDGSICTTCKTNYEPSSDGKTCNLICNIENCDECELDADTNNVKCKTCSTNYDKVNNGENCKLKCNADNCAECKTGSSTKCQLCNTNYTLVINEDNSTECKLTCKAKNCKECEDGLNTVCKTCNNGYKFNSNTNECEIDSDSTCIVLNCNECKEGDKNICNECDNGYEKVNNGKECKLKCIADNCEKCENGLPNVCKICKDGYNVNDIGECREDNTIDDNCKIRNCKECDANSTDVCKECEDDYELSLDGKQCNYFDNSAYLKFIILGIIILTFI